MKKMNILLICNAGMSTSLLIEKVKKVASSEDIDLEIAAHAADDVKNHLENRDIILLGPQVRFKQKNIQKLVGNRIPVEVIDMVAYGTLDGKKVLDQVIVSIQK